LLAFIGEVSCAIDGVGITSEQKRAAVANGDRRKMFIVIPLICLVDGASRTTLQSLIRQPPPLRIGFTAT
jgi:hypothetical protein